MSMTSYVESARRLSVVENEIIATKRQGMNSTPEQCEELIQSMDETLSHIAELKNEGYSTYDLAVAAQDLLGVDVDDFFEGPEED